MLKGIQLILATLLFFAATALIVGWAVMGRLSGAGYLIGAAVLYLTLSMVRIAYNELRGEEES